MNYCILKGPILAPAQYKYVSLVSDDGTSVNQVAVVRTDITEKVNLLVDLQLGAVGDDQELLNFFQTFLTSFPSIPTITATGAMAATVANVLNSSGMVWKFGAALTASIYGTPNKAVYRNDTLRNMNLAVIDPKASLTLELTAGK